MGYGETWNGTIGVYPSRSFAFEQSNVLLQDTSLILDGMICGTFIPYGANSLYVRSTRRAIGITTNTGIFILGLQTK